MNKDQAASYLNSVLAQIKGTRQEHEQMMAALAILVRGDAPTASDPTKKDK